jgi:hypothetical protein
VPGTHPSCAPPRHVGTRAPARSACRTRPAQVRHAELAPPPQVRHAEPASSPPEFGTPNLPRPLAPAPGPVERSTHYARDSQAQEPHAQGRTSEEGQGRRAPLALRPQGRARGAGPRDQGHHAAPEGRRSQRLADRSATHPGGAARAPRRGRLRQHRGLRRAGAGHRAHHHVPVHARLAGLQRGGGGHVRPGEARPRARLHRQDPRGRGAHRHPAARHPRPLRVGRCGGEAVRAGDHPRAPPGGAARGRQTGKKKRSKKAAALAAQAARVSEANRALDAAVGKADADRASVSLRDDGGDLLVDVRGLPLVHAGKALAALSKVLR